MQSAAAGSQAPRERKPSAPSLGDTCLAMCARLKEKCPDNAFQTCRVNCTKYDPPPSGCDAVVLSALSCARDATDVVCANLAPESCQAKFREISACASGKAPTAATPDTSSSALPVGFVLFELEQERIKAPMPEHLDSTGRDPTVLTSAKHPDGAVYTVRKLPRPPGKLNEKVFLKVALNLLGRCSDKMKLQGMVDKPGRTSIHYNTKCPDGSEEQGVFWATDNALFVANVKGLPGKLGPSDAFLYGFEAK